MSRTYRFVIADVFTPVPFAGNQLGVFTNAVGMADAEMQMLACELGFSETTFVLPPEGDADIRMRIFTPVCELPFAGHPTLGTAFVMAGPLQKVLLRIEIAAGVVPVMLEREGAVITFGRMTQPVPSFEPFAEAETLLEVLGVERSLLPVERYDNGVQHIFVALASEAAVTAVAPDFAALERVIGTAAVTCFHQDGDRVKSRVFLTGLGPNEDAATGSAAGPLAAHLARHGAIGWGEEITISQGAELGRPSTLYARAEGSDHAIDRVEVGGSAVVVARGEFVL